VASRSLYFTGGNRITRLDADGVEHVFRAPSGGANGLLFDRQGRLIACEAGNRRVTRTEEDGRITALADSYLGMKFNTPNDLAIDSKGRIYFSDPRHGLRDTMEMRDADGRLVEGVYRIDAPGTVERVIAHEVERPNSLLVSPDGRHLFVADNNSFAGNDLKTLYITAGGSLWSIRVNTPGWSGAR
jgi:gluconolactonase